LKLLYAAAPFRLKYGRPAAVTVHTLEVEDTLIVDGDVQVLFPRDGPLVYRLSIINIIPTMNLSKLWKRGETYVAHTCGALVDLHEILRWIHHLSLMMS
jgi:hypothetical protein